MRLLVLSFFLGISGWAMAQKRYVVQYEAAQKKLPISLKNSFSNRADAAAYIGQLPQTLMAKGFLAASVDSVWYDSTLAKVWLYTGRPYQWAEIQMDSTARQWVKMMNAEKGRSKNISLLWPPDSLQQSLLDYLANNGFPFASVYFDSVAIVDGAIHGKLLLRTGPPYKTDSIVQKGSLKLKPSFLYRYLQMKPGMAYNQTAMEGADKLLDELQFAERTSPSAIQMLGSGSLFNVYLNPKKSNVFNALIGAMPASTQTPNNQLLLTGDINLLLRNAFGVGEVLAVNWQQIQYKSPRLNLMYQQPYLFASRAGIDFQFDLFKKDTQFLNLQLRLGVPYQFDAQQIGKVFYQLQQNNVAFVDTNIIKLTRQLPDLANFSISNFGLEYEFNNTDYRFNPRRGWQVNALGMGGIKTIRKNNDILSLNDPSDPDFSFASLYDSLRLNTYAVRLKALAARYFGLGRQAVLKAAVQGGFIQSGNYFRNELFQIGGFRLLRGFDEESIFARAYAVSTAEYRYLTGQNSFLFAFVDAGYAAYRDELVSFSHTYIGTGVGINFQTKNSQVSLSWAVGKRNDLPLNLRQSKIHLGFVNFF
jgi:outer membrane protein assembly factor BamA